ncbi:hypothetical protein QYE76_035709 [Lolium multiflorum]|uniref:Uncharacterized protein n=1 Tax=Lolium multiflorum TaxID=4521 RepID=A0AAD8VNQ9_LOLMU|nr:hypothetical protein QYE76_035709 [Lolium multiflorum]
MAHLRGPIKTKVEPSKLVLARRRPPRRAIKVELSKLVLFILNDPVIDPLFGDMGFRGGDIKLTIIRPALPMSMLGRLWPAHTESLGTSLPLQLSYDCRFNSVDLEKATVVIAGG